MKGPVEYEYAPILENVELVAEAEIEQLAGVGDSKNNLVKVSKGMSAVLRHDKKGKVLRPDGWALLEKLRVNEKDAMKAVLDNNKERFAVGRGAKTKKLYVRAKQGHSIHVDVGLAEVLDPSTIPACMHGTTKSAWPLIEKTGLNRMSRQHIHFAKGMPGEVVSGMRDSSKVIIEIDVAKAMQDGIRFFESENGVILSDGIDGVILPVYFKNVIFK